MVAIVIVFLLYCFILAITQFHKIMIIHGNNNKVFKQELWLLVLSVFSFACCMMSLIVNLA